MSTIFSQFNPVYNLTSYVFKIRFISILPSTSRSQNACLSKVVYVFRPVILAATLTLLLGFRSARLEFRSGN
jgi:hypothetical protein